MYSFYLFILLLPASTCFFFFFFNDTATTEIYTLSLHDALPIWRRAARRGCLQEDRGLYCSAHCQRLLRPYRLGKKVALGQIHAQARQSVEFLGCLHTLGNHHASYLVREAREALGQRTAAAVGIDILRDAHVPLDHVWVQMQDVPHAGVAGPRIVDCQG